MHCCAVAVLICSSALIAQSNARSLYAPETLHEQDTLERSKRQGIIIHIKWSIILMHGTLHIWRTQARNKARAVAYLHGVTFFSIPSSGGGPFWFCWDDIFQCNVDFYCLSIPELLEYTLECHLDGRAIPCTFILQILTKCFCYCLSLAARLCNHLQIFSFVI